METTFKNYTDYELVVQEKYKVFCTLCDLFMKMTLNPSQGSGIFMMDLTSYVNKSQIQTKLYYFNNKTHKN